MVRQGRAAVVWAMLLVAALSAGVLLTTGVLAQSRTVDLSAPDAIRVTLDQQTGKRVKVKLNSGQDLEGLVGHVGGQAVTLTNLTGQDFFDATIRMDQIAAVIVRVR